MSFAAPLLLGLLGLALPITALYILKVRRRRVDVPYLRLWQELVVESRARSLFQRLKRLYSLLLQLLILASLILAAADPAFELSSVKRESIVVLLDCSASMHATEADGEARFEALMERARRLVEDRSHEDEMMLAAVSDRVDVLCSFNRSTLRLRAALARAELTKRSLDVGRALDFARAVAAGKEHPVVLVLSDGAGGELLPQVQAEENVYWIPVGEAEENLGIVRFSARKNTSLGTDYVLGVVKNFGQEARDCRVELVVDGTTRKVLTRTIEAGAELKEDWQLNLPEGGVLQLRVEPVAGEGTEEGAEAEPVHDALSLDDEAWAIVRPSRLRKVAVVVDEAFRGQPFLIALDSMAEVVSPESFAVTGDKYAQLTERETRADVTVCVGVVPENLPREGNLILLDVDPPDFLPARLKGVEEKPTVWDWDREHLLNRYLNYRELPLPPARTIALEGGTALVESYEGPLLSAFEQGDRRVVYVAFDMTAELFPFRLAFPMLLRNAIAWFEVEEDVLLEASYEPGDVVRPLRRLAEGTPALVTYGREGEVIEQPLELHDGRFYFTDTEEPGTYLFRVGGKNHPVCVNLFDPGESAVAPGELPAEEESYAEKGGHLFNRDLWTLFAFLGLALWALEWALYHRRVTE